MGNQDRLFRERRLNQDSVSELLLQEKRKNVRFVLKNHPNAISSLWDAITDFTITAWEPLSAMAIEHVRYVVRTSMIPGLRRQK